MAVDQSDDASPRGTALLLGANGFLGGFVAAALRRHGWQVIRGVRKTDVALHEDERLCDLACMLTPQAWTEALKGVDVVVNAAGVLREHGIHTFEAIHFAAPLACAQACVAGGVRCFVQISVLGNPADGEFIASKYRFDAQLLRLPLRAVVLRPSLVYATGGSYGGTSSLRALSAFPGFQILPGSAHWRVAPLAAEDLATLVVRALETGTHGAFDVGGPQSMSLRDYQSSWRRWMRIEGARALRVPELLVSLQVWLWERVGRGPVGATMWRMLRRGNLAAPGSAVRVQTEFGFALRRLDDVLATHPSQVQDRWQAQLYFLAPTLRVAMVLLWLMSGATGLLAPAADIERLFAEASQSPIAPIAYIALARATGVLDVALALWLASGFRPRAAVGLMGISVVAYTTLLGWLLPSAWLDLLGGLAKNLVVLPALAVLWVLLDRR